MTPNIKQTVLTDPLYAAIQLLTEEADSLRECHTRTPDDWTGEPEAKAAYDHILAVVAALSKLRAPVADERAAFPVELSPEQEERFSKWAGLGGMTPWERSVARLALLLNSTNRGLIDYAAAQHFARELTARAALASAPVAGEAVAWLKEDGSDAWTDQKKRNAADHNGTPGARLAETYNVPLFRYAAPQASAEPKREDRPSGSVIERAQQEARQIERRHAAKARPQRDTTDWHAVAIEAQAKRDAAREERDAALRAGDELTRLRAENQRLRNGVDQDMAEVGRLQALYDSEWRKCRKLRTDESVVRRALVAASNYIDTLGGDSKSYRDALSVATQAEQGERDAQD